MRTTEFLNINLLFKASEESILPPHEIQASPFIKEFETGSSNQLLFFVLKDTQRCKYNANLKSAG